MRETSVKIPEELANKLKIQMKEFGMTSLTTYAHQVLERETAYGRSFFKGPIQVPVGLSDSADELVKFMERWKKDRKEHNAWNFVYRAPSGAVLCVPGKIENIEPTVLSLMLVNPQVPFSIPRAALICWGHMKDGYSDNEIMNFIRPLQRWGAFLHPSVQIAGREVNGILWPPQV